MGEQFDAGSIFVKFQGAAQGIENAANKATKSVSRFERMVAKSSQKVEASSQKVATAFNGISKETSALAGRASSMAQRLIGVQLAMQTVIGAAGEQSKAMRTAAQSFSAFAAIVSVFPSPAGLVIGALTAIGIALWAFISDMDDAEKAFVSFTEKVDAFNKASIDLEKRLLGIVLKTTVLAENASTLGLKVDEIKFKEAAEEVQLLTNRLVELDQQVLSVKQDLEDAPDEKFAVAARNELSRLAGERRSLEQRLTAAAQRKDELKGLIDQRLEEEKLRKAIDGRIAASKSAIATQAEALDLSMRRLSNEDKALKSQEAMNAELDKMAARLKELTGQDVSFEKVDFQPLIDAAKKADFQQRFSAPFAHSVASGLQDAFMQSKEPLQALADFGEKAFGDMVGSFAADLETTLTETLTNVVGAAGEQFGKLASAIVGVAGFFLSGRGRGKTTQTYGDVDGVTSTQAVRGVVAGPTTVAISAVGDNLSRSFRPVVQRLDALILIGQQLVRNTGGGSAAGGAAFAGTTATD